MLPWEVKCMSTLLFRQSRRRALCISSIEGHQSYSRVECVPRNISQVVRGCVASQKSDSLSRQTNCKSYPTSALANAAARDPSLLPSSRLDAGRIGRKTRCRGEFTKYLLGHIVGPEVRRLQTIPIRLFDSLVYRKK